jgi:hypothetical protein
MMPAPAALIKEFSSTLDSARQLQGQQQRAEGWTPAHEQV